MPPIFPINMEIREKELELFNNTIIYETFTQFLPLPF